MGSLVLPARAPVTRERPDRVLRGVATLLWLGLVATVAVSLVVYVGRGLPRQPISFAHGPLGTLAVAMTALVYGTVGPFIVRRRARNLIAWIFMGIGIAMAMILPLNMALADALRTFRPIPNLDLLLAWALTSVQLPASGALLVLVLLLFPHGRPEWRHWRVAAGVALLGAVLMSVASALQPDGLLWYPSLPNPTAAPRDALGALSALRVGGMGLLVGGLTLAGGWLLFRYRLAGPSRRRQLLWVMLGGLAMVVTLAPLFVVRYSVGASDALGEQLLFVAAVGGCLFPLTVALACLREHLFGVDAIMSRTLVYLPLTALLGGAYTAAVIVMQRLFVLFTGNTSDAAFIIATLLVAAVLTPVRRALEGTAERILRDPAPPSPVEPPVDACAHGDDHHDQLRGVMARLAELEARLAGPDGASPVAGARAMVVDERDVDWS